MAAQCLPLKASELKEAPERGAAFRAAFWRGLGGQGGVLTIEAFDLAGYPAARPTAPRRWTAMATPWIRPSSTRAATLRPRRSLPSRWTKRTPTTARLGGGDSGRGRNMNEPCQRLNDELSLCRNRVVNWSPVELAEGPLPAGQSMFDGRRALELRPRSWL